MANSASAKKRIRQTATRTDVNRARLSAIRSAVRKVEEAICWRRQVRSTKRASICAAADPPWRTKSRGACKCCSA